MVPVADWLACHSIIRHLLVLEGGFELLLAVVFLCFLMLRLAEALSVLFLEQGLQV